MDVTSVGSTAAVHNTQSSDVSVELHKKTLEIQEQAAKQLIESVPDPDSSLGQNVDEMV